MKIKIKNGVIIKVILLERTVPFYLLALESLVRRMNPNDIKYQDYLNKYTNRLVGFEGELTVDKEWYEMDIPVEYSLLHNFETVNESGKHLQIDSLFLSRHFIWLIEAKNFSGILSFDEDKSQFIREKIIDGSINSFYNPVDQIEKYRRFVRRTIRRWGIDLPVEPAIIIVRESAIIKDVPKSISVFHLSGIQSKLDNLFQKYPQPRISETHYKDLQMKFLSMYRRHIWRPNIQQINIKKGVYCKKCDYRIKMLFYHGSYICPVCNTKSKDAFLQAVYDYKYLFDDWIMNRELRQFLEIDSRYSVGRLMRDLNFETVGKYRNKRYLIPENINHSLLVRKNG